MSIINIIFCAFTSKSPPCAGSRGSAFPNTLFMAALQILPCLLTQRSEAFSSSFSLIMLEQLDHGASTGLVHVENQGKGHVGASRGAPLLAPGRR